jgi:phosphonate transport system substrate-binding protein
MNKLFFTLVSVVFLNSALYSDHISKSDIVLGFMPYVSPIKIIEKYTPLAEYLSKQLKTRVSIQIAKNYTEHLENVKNDKYDIAFLGGSPYIYVADNFNKKNLLVRYEFNNKPTFRSVVFVNKNSKIETIKELDGKSIALGNKKSTLSSQVPMYMIMKNGVDIENTKFTFLDNHENVFLGVLFGEFNGGAIAEEIFLEHQKRGLKAVGYSDEISTHVFTASDNLTNNDKKEIQEALLSLKENNDSTILKSISKNLTGFVSVENSDYDMLREILKVAIPVLERK